MNAENNDGGLIVGPLMQGKTTMAPSVVEEALRAGHTITLHGPVNPATGRPSVSGFLVRGKGKRT